MAQGGIPQRARQHALACVSNSRASHRQAHAFGAAARQEQIHILVERGLPHSLPTGSVPDAKKVELRGRDRRGRPIVWCVRTTLQRAAQAQRAGRTNNAPSAVHAR